MQHSIKVGVFDWGKFGADESYYPSDLPRAWRLSFYANEFDSACLSLGDFDGQTELLMELTEDLPESFELSFVINRIDQVDLLSDLIQQNHLKPSYVLLKSTQDQLLTQIQQSLARFREPLTDMQLLSSRQSMWQPHQPDAVPQQVALVPARAGMRDYRGWVENWLDSLSSAQTPLNLTFWLEAEHANYKTLADCRTLVELMGY